MKLTTFIAVFVSVVALFAVVAMGCPDGFTAYGKDVCVQDLKPEAAPDVYKVDDAKPPTDKMPSYQREGIVADMPPSCAAQDAKMDQERDQADKQGKKNAGIN